MEFSLRLERRYTWNLGMNIEFVAGFFSSLACYLYSSWGRRSLLLFTRYYFVMALARIYFVLWVQCCDGRGAVLFLNLNRLRQSTHLGNLTRLLLPCFISLYDARPSLFALAPACHNRIICVSGPYLFFFGGRGIAECIP